MGRKVWTVDLIDREIAKLEKDRKELADYGLTACFARIKEEEIKLFKKKRIQIIKDKLRQEEETDDE